jgi:hypothetical protein
MKKDDDKGKQIRLTLEDTLFYQNEMRELLKILISENRPLSFKEKQSFFEMLPKALLSQGAVEPVYFVKDKGWFIFSSVQNLAHRLADLSGEKVQLRTSRPEKVEITITIGELWQFFYDKCLFLFPQACSEAIHMSAESVERPVQGSFDFTSKGDLG